MTDITNQDRRDMLEWANDAIAQGDASSPRARTVAYYVRATVDAPAPTLAEELARIAENSPVWTVKNVCDELTAATARAEQMERDLAEARAEVERLTAANEQLRRTDNYREFKESLGVQKGAESNAESNDPADVKPGEAWIVEVNGKRGTAMKDGDSLMPWGVVTDGTFSSRDAGEITLVSRLVPAPSQITTREELYELPRRTVIRDKDGVVCERASLGGGWYSPESTTDQGPFITFPATVLWTPEG